MLSDEMRRINKCPAPPTLAKEKKTCGNNWDNVSQGTKKLWRDQLFKEQKGLDAYTEEILSLDDKTTTHIDHFKKRAHHPELTFDWGNLFLANHQNNKAYGADAKDNGTNKIEKDKYDDLIYPAAKKEDPHEYFTYSLEGDICPREGLDDTRRKKAQFTIDTFCLNSPVLLKSRNGILRILQSYQDQLEESFEYLKGNPFPSLIECYKQEKWWLLQKDK